MTPRQPGQVLNRRRTCLMVIKSNLLNKLFDEEESHTEEKKANSTAIKNSAEHLLKQFKSFYKEVK